MMSERQFTTPELNGTGTKADQPIVEELVKVLAPHPAGLRRWSVMRAISSSRERASMDVSPRFENEVERVFRRFCADFGDSKSRTCSASSALFHRPSERAGEVWAVYPDRAHAWLASEGLGSGKQNGAAS
ncbi:MAG TPA: hypothetical protein VGF97_16505 [Rhizomicrobium sp.]